MTKIRKLEASLAKEESKKANIDEVLDTIETEVTTTKEGLISDLTQVSAIEGTIQAANVVAQKQRAWNSLRASFTKFA